MRTIRTLRLALFLALLAMLEVGGGSLPSGPEALEDFEEAAHGRRRLVRLARQPAPPSTETESAPAAAPRERLIAHRPRARSATAPPRKAPALVSDPASSTEDH
jgi:hypothetical protein